MPVEIQAQFDHLVIGAETLDAGAAWAERVLGADIAPGGAHPLMSTHNRLARLPVGYLEIIAVDPSAPAPARPRWYGLDAPETRARLATGPQPLTWVVAVADLDAAAAAAREADWAPGEILTVTRGDLSWRMTVPADGAPPEGGVLPTLIEWPESLGRAAPRDQMRDAGLELTGLTLRCPDRSAILQRLRAVGADMPGVALAVEDGPPGISVGLSTPKGPVLV
ncbi:MAG: VOC family protein [Pseudomonadota bacterium]